ncbi:MAG: DUF190 domain-containing protein [Rudaea sp.]|uniref:DUF190 domain-containing protein n=1 Tax=Rudaea sp. TaxID=2136325 RepID=UPI0039E6E12E
MLLYEWLLERARKLGIHGGSAFRAIAGYGRHGRLHEQQFFELAGEGRSWSNSSSAMRKRTSCSRCCARRRSTCSTRASPPTTARPKRHRLEPGILKPHRNRTPRRSLPCP